MWSEDRERELVRAFFNRPTGFFVEVGANDPHERSQSWHLEQLGWSGVLIEPEPELAQKLRRSRRAKVFAVACSSPENAGKHLSFYVAGPMSSIDRNAMAPGAQPEKIIDVPARTLDDILFEAGAPVPFDFLSIDVEGHEIDVLRGFDFVRWQPRLILLEDHVGDLSKHKYISRAGYKLVRRTGHNGWYVPRHANVAFGWRERFAVTRKYYLALPFRMLRDMSRRLRQPFKDARRAREKAR